nr:hypothetical protein [uncultured Flavobacterium sp.]
MEELNPIQKLDLVLNYFKKHNKIFHNLYEVFQNLNGITVTGIAKNEEPKVIALEDIDMAIGKINKDGYLYAKLDTPPLGSGTAITHYKINFDGFIFIGYEATKRISDDENTRLENLEKHQKESDENMNTLTLFLVVIGAMTVVIELVKFWRDSQCCNCH